MASLPDIAEVEDILFRLDATMGASEAHGALCGMLCAQGTTSLSDWINHVLGEQQAGNALLQNGVQLLSNLHQIATSQIEAGSAEFALFLPNDDNDLSERVNALAAWCQGYIYGLAAGGISQDSELPGDTKELVSDLIEISRAGHNEDTEHSQEEDERAFMEITEYVRMGILLINEELQPLQTAQRIQ